MIHSRDRRNASYHVTAGILWSFAVNLVAPMTVLAVLLTQHQAPKWMIGSLLTIQAALHSFPQLLGTRIIRPGKHRKNILVGLHIVGVLPMFVLIAILEHFSDRLSHTTMQWSLLGCYFVHNFFVGVCMAVWQDWISHVYAPSVRGKLLGLYYAMSAVAATASAAVAGAILLRYQGSTGYTLLFIMAPALGLISLGLFIMIDDPASQQRGRGRTINLRRLLVRFRDSLRDMNFRAFLIGRLLCTLGFSVLPFIATYYTSTQGGGLSAGQVVSYSAASAVAAVVANLGLGYIGDHRGHRTGVLVGAATQVATLMILLNLTGPTGCVLAFACAGICAGAATTSHYNILIETCPHNDRAAHITVGNLLMAPAGISAPIIGGWIAQVYDIRLFFQISLTISIVAVLWLLLRMKEPRTIAVFGNGENGHG